MSRKASTNLPIYKTYQVKDALFNSKIIIVFLPWGAGGTKMVRGRGFEPLTPCMSSRYSNR
jgi:hypothetical protein